jgi:hypothetical protein
MAKVRSCLWCVPMITLQDLLVDESLPRGQEILISDRQVTRCSTHWTIQVGRVPFSSMHWGMATDSYTLRCLVAFLCTQNCVGCSIAYFFHHHKEALSIAPLDRPALWHASLEQHANTAESRDRQPKCNDLGPLHRSVHDSLCSFRYEVFYTSTSIFIEAIQQNCPLWFG